MRERDKKETGFQSSKFSIMQIWIWETENKNHRDLGGGKSPKNYPELKRKSVQHIHTMKKGSHSQTSL